MVKTHWAFSFHFQKKTEILTSMEPPLGFISSKRTQTVIENSTTYDNWTLHMFTSTIYPDDVDPNEEIARMMQVIGRPPIIVLGTIGNLLTFFTMQRGSLKEQSTCFYMAILSLADTGEFHFTVFFSDNHGNQ